jgi:PAS domain S-box-containing protein/putative nucleotidyltransferase with HDIG domain
MNKKYLPISIAPLSNGDAENIALLVQEAIERLAAIVIGSDDAIIGKNLDRIITSWNHGAEVIFGYSSEEAIGQSINLILPAEFVLEEEEITQKILQGKRVSHFRASRICKDGRTIAISATISPIFDASGAVIGSSKIARDISDQIAEEHRLSIANNNLLYEAGEIAKRVEELTSANAEKLKHAAGFTVANQKLQESLMETIDLVRQLIELHNPYVAGHEQHVGDLAKAIALEMGFDKERQEGLRIAGYLHDIGKIIIPSEILCKPGKISAEEYDLVKNHAQTGFDLLNVVTFPWPISRPVLEHHERLDGSGYPNGLSKNQISIEGCILAVADVVDSISSHRPYRAALGIDFALAEIKRGQGTLFHSDVVEACLRLFRDKKYVIKTLSH